MNLPFGCAPMVSDRIAEPPKALVAVVIPCLNEATTIGKVIDDFRGALPDARIIVIDNLSKDGTGELARAAGADVLVESRRGKGYALIRGFQASRDAEYVVVVDGDDTYPAEDASKLLAALQGGADMAIGTRLMSHEAGAV